MKRLLFQRQCYLHALKFVLAAFVSSLVGVGTARTSDVPALGTIITNVQKQLQENGTWKVATNRYRVTGDVIKRTAQVDDFRPPATGPDSLMWGVAANGSNPGTLINDLPPLVLVTRQRGFMRLKQINSDTSRPDFIPDNLKKLFVQASSALGFWARGTRSHPEPERAKWTCIAPIDHPGVKVFRRDVGPDPEGQLPIFSVDIDMLSGITTNIVNELWEGTIGSYMIVDGKDLVVSVGIDRDELWNASAQVLSSWSPASESARGVYYENENTLTNVFLNEYGAAHIGPQRADIYNSAWGAEFMPLELLSNTPTVTLANRMTPEGLEIFFTPALPSDAQLESSATISGGWQAFQRIPAGSAMVLIETSRLPPTVAFFRLRPLL